MSEVDESDCILITGAASGIGRHLAGRLLEDGHRVVCTDIDREAVEQWIGEGDYPQRQVCVQRLDVRQPDDWAEAFDRACEQFDQVDVLMNVAGYLKPCWLEKVTDADVDMHIDVNVKGVIYGTRAAAARMVERGDGHIINIGSLASLTPVPGLSLYGASKFGVRGFSLSVAEELRAKGVDVSVVMLDAVKTPMLDLQVDHEEAALTFSGRRPLELSEVEQLMVEDVLKQRPLEVTLPRTRGWLARFAGLVPDVVRLMQPLLERRGRNAQQKFESSD